ncbi:hypothetical protein QEH59_06935 [Coraliomargarita sp. SDUM461004]|uniref:Transposase n=1 Tax=Thalassobacterium sedimentorum TaxID=3041258 RepID=A0ABU1AHJ0_9BACT|nr:hypothetical protein [Coraliomargarita sp. SDUM461004]MDQ8194152.1 hypothetical protein [Coraliomargarita sp. SDUM461004]
MERYDASGLTQEAFSRREGIRYGTLVAWLGRQWRVGLCKAPEVKKETIRYERLKASKREPSAERFADLPVKETIEILPDEVRANPELDERIGITEETFEVRITPPLL